MKNFKITSILVAITLNGYFLSAATSFSGVFAGSTGVNCNVPTNDSSSEWQIPLSTFAAAQVDFADSFTVRGEIDIQATDFPPYRIFKGNDATIKLHELSFVYTKRAITSTHFLSAFLGYYEPIGCDTFLMRQFGIDPISSPLTKSVTNIAGAPLYSNSGGGFSYIVRMDKTPVSTGGYLYFYNNTNDRIVANLDFRVATALQNITIDFVTGIGAPLRDNGVEDDDNYVVAIKTLTLHSGLNMLLGSKYSHGMLIQLGINNFVLTGTNKLELLDADISAVIESRIRFETFGLNFTAYSLPHESIENLLYLTDTIGASTTFFVDSIETANGTMTAGIHLICSLGGDGIDLASFVNYDKKFTDAELDLFASPYAEIPFSPSSKIELMGQLGLMNITNGKPTINFKFIAGFRKQF